MAPGDELLAEYERRTRELEALYETAGDLSALRDVNQVLAAIVRRSRQLLASDVAYLMLNDEERREAYMRVGEGIQNQDFMSIRLAYGEGLGGLVAKTGMPQWTSDYHSDTRFAPKLDAIVRKEALKAVLGVPLKIGPKVTGVLFASDRHRREYAHSEVALLSSLASHAAIALENASLFEASQHALHMWKQASARVEQQNRMLERAARLHETLTALVLSGAPLSALADAVAEAIGGRVVILDVDGTPLTPGADPADLPDIEHWDELVPRTGGSVQSAGLTGSTLRIAPAQAGVRRLGYLVHLGSALPVTDVRSLERAALVTALLLLDRRARDDARAQAMGELLADVASRAGVDDDWVRLRARTFRVTLPEPPYVSLAAVASSGSDGEDRLDAAAALAMLRGGLARVQGDEAYLVLNAVEAAQTARDVAGQLSEAQPSPVTVGADGPFDALIDAVAAFPRARMCAKVLETTGQTGRGATPGELGVYALLFSEVGRDQIEDFVATTIGRVQTYDAEHATQLMQTLSAYFDVGGQTGKAADVLFIHVNTLYQRLERVDSLISAEWRRGEQSLQVHLALRLAQLLQKSV
jgi:hypothetical protein